MKIIKTFIKRMLSVFECEFEILGGKIKGRMISPKGLYSRPKNCDSVTIFENNSKMYIIPLHNDKKLLVSLNDNDVLIEDEKSYIYFDYANESITMKSKTITLNADKININGSSEVNIATNKMAINASVSLDVVSGYMKHNKINVGFDHKHPPYLKPPIP